ncbi:MAG: carboxypeptidase M32 [Alicyclobacillus sp.]|nr:carboxypeptidase M32 [Alicyclobacillus sp.]
MPNTAEAAAAFRELLRKISHYEEALALMAWDLRTGAPKKGVPLRSEAMGTLASEAFALRTSAEMGELLAQLTDGAAAAELDPVVRAAVHEVQKEYDRFRKIPPDRYQAYVVLTTQAESVWEEAKHTSDFRLFQPYLEKIVAMKREFVEYWGYHGHPYNTLLDQYEPGMTVDQLDALFTPLRQQTVELVQAIAGSGVRPDVRPFRGSFDKERQRHLSRCLLERMGYDFSAGRLDETVHPFQTTLNRYDARVTTMFVPDDVRPAISSTLHEGGHALYEQGIDPALIGTPLSQGASMGIHESQSRFWENIIGRSREFWEAQLPLVQQVFPELSGVSAELFYRGMNDVAPSLIRIEADEVTYNLHIMVRYELEKGLMSGDLRVADLPGLWREKMREYLGVEPDADATGVLQDVHWSGGDFGYFPSYALGNLYAAQFRSALARDLPDYREQVRRGELGGILAWLREHIHRYGKTRTPAELVQQVTGQPLRADDLVAYLHEKFRPLYGL